MSLWPVYEWYNASQEDHETMDTNIIGEIHRTASNGHRYILVAIDCFTKWVEA